MPREPLGEQLEEARARFQEQEKELAREEIARMKAIMSVLKSALEQAETTRT
jgi:hypothetical protein